MKNLLWLLCLICTVSLAQKVDYNTIILPPNAKDVEFSEKLVQLAWQNHPSNEVVKLNKTAADLEIKKSRWGWLDKVGAQGNLNEFTIKGRDPDGPVGLFFPRYNIGIALSLGDLVTRPMQTNIYKQKAEIAAREVDQQKLYIRAQVLSAYQIYLSSKEILDVRTEVFTESEDDLKLKEQQFTRAEITLSDYNNIVDAHNQKQINMLTAKKELALALIDLEQLIGVKLADVK